MFVYFYIYNTLAQITFCHACMRKSLVMHKINVVFQKVIMWYKIQVIGPSVTLTDENPENKLRKCTFHKAMTSIKKLMLKVTYVTQNENNRC